MEKPIFGYLDPQYLNTIRKKPPILSFSSPLHYLVSPTKTHLRGQGGLLTWPLQKDSEQAGTAAEGSLLTVGIDTLAVKAEPAGKLCGSELAQTVSK